MQNKEKLEEKYPTELKLYRYVFNVYFTKSCSSNIDLTNTLKQKEKEEKYDDIDVPF